MPARRILVVDDDDVLRDSLVEQLSLYEEFDIAQDSTAAKGVARARAEPLDLVIMDVGLPARHSRWPGISCWIRISGRSIPNTICSSPASCNWSRQSCAASRCSTARTRAIAPPAIRAGAAPATRRRCSLTSRTTTSACRAIHGLTPISIRRIATSGFAAPSARISPTIRNFCGAFKVPTLRNVATRKVFFSQRPIHVAARRLALLRAPRHQSRGVLSGGMPTAPCRSSTICPRICVATSTPKRFHTTVVRASPREAYRRRGSTISKLF